MKKLLFWLGVVAVFAACSTQKGVVKIKAENKEEAQQDTVEYELETFDERFETWYQLHDNPAQYRSKEYYENWNDRYVSAWNANALDPQKSSFFETIIGWDPTIDYGFELNYKLFYYFQYVERVLGIQIMPGGPKSIML